MEKQLPEMAATLSSDSTDQGHDLQPPLSPPLSPPQEKVCIDDMLQNYCGEFGRWQLKQFILTSIPWALEAFHTMVMIFADHEPHWKCLPGAAGSGCHADAASFCHLKPGSWEWVGGRGRSTVSEWGLICGDKFKVGLVHSLFFCGCMIGAGVFGHLSDSFLGRKGSLIVACILNSIFGCLTALSPKYWTYVLLRLLTGISTGGLGINAFALATEPVGPTKRGVAGMSTFYFFSSGIALLSGIAYYFQQWRHLYIATSIPSFLFVIFVIPFIWESPRWYIVRGKVKEAMKLMSTIASTNGKHLPSNIIVALDLETSPQPKDGKEAALPNDGNSPKRLQPRPQFKTSDGKETSLPNDSNNATRSQPQLQFKTLNDIEASSVANDGSSHDLAYKKKGLENKEPVVGSIVDLLRSPITRVRLFLAVDISFLVCVVYYGLSLNVVNLKINLYLNVALNALAELPAFLITALLLDRFGRKRLTMGTMFFSGFFCIVGSLTKNVGVWKVVKMVCGVLGIFGMAGTYNLLFIYIAELFPTVVRNAALGCSAQASQMGAILAPFVVVLGGWLPFAVFAACGILGGVFVLFLPETLNQPLYDTFTGLEAAVK